MSSLPFYLGAFLVGVGVVLLAILIVSVLWVAAQGLGKLLKIATNDNFVGLVVAGIICLVCTGVGIFVLRSL